MTRSELVAALAEEHQHLTLGDIERVVTAIFDEMTAALAEGGRVELRGFGAFSVKRRRARVGRNPRTGQTVDVAEKSVPFFRAGRELREMVNEGSPAKARSSRPASRDGVSP
jgi:integration host factor subunit beta